MGWATFWATFFTSASGHPGEQVRLGRFPALSALKTFVPLINEFVENAQKKLGSVFSVLPVFNNMCLPSGVKFDPRGELCPLGRVFTPSNT
jgi:hypothetical protein